MTQERIEIEGHEYVCRAIILQKFGINPATCVRWENAGILPKPLKLGKQRFYRLDEVDRHISRLHH
jgi:hypothetical protein